MTRPALLDLAVRRTYAGGQTKSTCSRSRRFGSVPSKAVSKYGFTPPVNSLNVGL